MDSDTINKHRRPKPPCKLFMKASDLARAWDYHPETIAAWCRGGEIPGAKKPKGRWLIPLKWVEDAGGLE